MRLTGLSKQIVLSMSILMLSGTVIMWASSWLFWVIALRLDPEMLSAPTAWMPSAAEWVSMLIISAIGVFLATIAAAKLAGRILTPVNSVMESVRRVARGDLTARALAGDRTLGETATLVDDFNSMAERLERAAKESLTWNAAIAHELRTPVTILQGTLQGLVDGVFKPEEIEFRGLLSQVEGLGRLIEDLRTLSLADSGTMRLHLGPADLDREIRAVARLLQQEMSAAGFTLHLTLADEAVRCDAARMRQVVLALLDNARKYANPGIIRIETGWIGQEYYLKVEDAGPGMDDDDIEHVFDAFRRGAQAQVLAHSGSGLGLAVVDAIARAHGGIASCCRSKAGGSIFMVKWLAKQ